jgi:hypothetical protein
MTPDRDHPEGTWEGFIEAAFRKYFNHRVTCTCMYCNFVRGWLGAILDRPFRHAQRRAHKRLGRIR